MQAWLWLNFSSKLVDKILKGHTWPFGVSVSARLRGKRERVSRFHREKKREKEEGRKKKQGRARHFQGT